MVRTSEEPARESRLFAFVRLTAPDGRVAASGEYARYGFIELGWWRGPGTYTFSADYAGMHVETSVTLDGTEHDLSRSARAGRTARR
jgi:hypothetical protein